VNHAVGMTELRFTSPFLAEMYVRVKSKYIYIRFRSSYEPVKMFHFVSSERSEVVGLYSSRQGLEDSLSGAPVFVPQYSDL
jgi:hypothetical protein